MNSAKCHICGYENKKTDGQPSLCMVCGTDLAGTNAETKLLEATKSATYSTSDRMADVRKEAFIYLTDKRLIVIPADVQFEGVGVLVFNRINY